MPYALFEVVRALNEAPATDLIYSDEDKTDDTGEERWDPFFKPDWSPDLLLTTNYICHFGVYRRSLVEAIGGFRSEYDGSQDYDLVLRFTERTDRIVHLPSILYSWRAIPGSTARDMMAKPSCRGRRAARRRRRAPATRGGGARRTRLLPGAVARALRPARPAGGHAGDPRRRQDEVPPTVPGERAGAIDLPQLACPGHR